MGTTESESFSHLSSVWFPWMCFVYCFFAKYKTRCQHKMVGNQSLRNGFIGSQHTGVLFWYEPFECLGSPNPGFIKQPLHTSYVDSCKNRRNSEVNFFGGSGWSTVNSCSSGVVRFSGYLYEFSLETLKGSQRRLQQLRESGETWDAVQEMISRTVHTIQIWLMFQPVMLVSGDIHFRGRNISASHATLVSWRGLAQHQQCVYILRWYIYVYIYYT